MPRPRRPRADLAQLDCLRMTSPPEYLLDMYKYGQLDLPDLQYIAEYGLPLAVMAARAAIGVIRWNSEEYWEGRDEHD